jgi:hypothetical protein
MDVCASGLFSHTLEAIGVKMTTPMKTLKMQKYGTAKIKKTKSDCS